MAIEKDILEPRKAFLEYLKEEHHNNVVSFFEQLTKQSGINVNANRDTIALINKYQKESNRTRDTINKTKTKKTFAIIGIVVFSIAAILFGTMTFLPKTRSMIVVSIITSLVSIGLVVLFSLLIGKKINPVLRSNSTILDRLIKEIDNQKTIGYCQLEKLNSLYDWNMHTRLVQKTIPLFEMDNYFNIKRYQYMVDKFGFNKNDSKKHSSVFVQSGSILGNPFVIEKARIQTMGTCTYTGSIVITYTERVRDSEGRTHLVTRTQTLTATISKPKPYYHYEKKLYYCNEAAPNLSFSRIPVKADTLSEKEYQKLIRKNDEKLNKLSEKKINKGFTPMANTEFETLFNGLDRDNEVEFRLLFTPLAQRNLVDLLKNSQPFGDDFTFIKRGTINKITSKHSQSFDYVCNPTSFINYDYDNAKANFINFNDAYFESFYFDIAPLISIPLYQQYPTDEYIFNKKMMANITSFEAEVMANSFDEGTFSHPKSATPAILKSEFLRNDDYADRVLIFAYSFEGVPRTEYVSKMGRDGYMHTIPVEWIEYLPVRQANCLEIHHQDGSRKSFNELRKKEGFKSFVKDKTKDGQIRFERNLFSFIPKDGNEEYNPKTIDSLFKNALEKDNVKKEGKNDEDNDL